MPSWRDDRRQSQVREADVINQVCRYGRRKSRTVDMLELRLRLPYGIGRNTQRAAGSPGLARAATKNRSSSGTNSAVRAPDIVGMWAERTQASPCTSNTSTYPSPQLKYTRWRFASKKRSSVSPHAPTAAIALPSRTENTLSCGGFRNPTKTRPELSSRAIGKLLPLSIGQLAVCLLAKRSTTAISRAFGTFTKMRRSERAS